MVPSQEEAEEKITVNENKQQLYHLYKTPGNP
jgi:hypothetical protein